MSTKTKHRRANAPAARRKEAAKRAVAAQRLVARRVVISGGVLVAAAGTLLLLSTRNSASVFPPSNLIRFRTFTYAGGALLVAFGLAGILASRPLSRRLARHIPAFTTFIKGCRDSALHPFVGLGRLNVAVFWVLVALGTGLRLAYISQPMRYDEAFTFTHYSAWPWVLGIADYSAPNNHLFFTLTSHISYDIFGNAPWALRLPAFLAGVALIPATYALGRVFYDARAAVIAMALVATSPILIEYSVNGRGYSLIALISTLLIISAKKILDEPSLPAFSSFGVLSVIGIFTIPVMAYPIAIALTWLAISVFARGGREKRKEVLRGAVATVLAISVATLVIWLPAIFLSGPRAIVANGDVKSLSMSDFAKGLGSHLDGAWALVTRGIPGLVVVILAAGFLVAMIVHARIGTVRIPVEPVAVFVSLAAIAIQRVLPYARVWIFLIPILLTGSAAGIAFCVTRPAAKNPRLMPRLAATTALIAAVAVSVPAITTHAVTNSTDTGVAPSSSSAALFLKSQLRPGDIVVTATPANATLRYYFIRYGIDTSYLVSNESEPQRIFVFVNEPGQTLDSVAAASGITLDKSIHTEEVARFDHGALYLLTPAQDG